MGVAARRLEGLPERRIVRIAIGIVAERYREFVGGGDGGIEVAQNSSGIRFEADRAGQPRRPVGGFPDPLAIHRTVVKCSLRRPGCLDKKGHLAAGVERIDAGDREQPFRQIGVGLPHQRQVLLRRRPAPAAGRFVGFEDDDRHGVRIAGRFERRRGIRPGRPRSADCSRRHHRDENEAGVSLESGHCAP